MTRIYQNQVGFNEQTFQYFKFMVLNFRLIKLQWHEKSLILISTKYSIKINNQDVSFSFSVGSSSPFPDIHCLKTWK